MACVGDLVLGATGDGLGQDVPGLAMAATAGRNIRRWQPHSPPPSSTTATVTASSGKHRGSDALMAPPSPHSFSGAGVVDIGAGGLTSLGPMGLPYGQPSGIGSSTNDRRLVGASQKEGPEVKPGGCKPRPSSRDDGALDSLILPFAVRQSVVTESQDVVGRALICGFPSGMGGDGGGDPSCGGRPALHPDRGHHSHSTGSGFGSGFPSGSRGYGNVSTARTKSPLPARGGSEGSGGGRVEGLYGREPQPSGGSGAGVMPASMDSIRSLLAAGDSLGGLGMGLGSLGGGGSISGLGAGPLGAADMIAGGGNGGAQLQALLSQLNSSNGYGAGGQLQALMSQLGGAAASGVGEGSSPPSAAATLALLRSLQGGDGGSGGGMPSQPTSVQQLLAQLAAANGGSGGASSLGVDAAVLAGLLKTEPSGGKVGAPPSSGGLTPQQVALLQLCQQQGTPLTGGLGGSSGLGAASSGGGGALTGLGSFTLSDLPGGRLNPVSAMSIARDRLQQLQQGLEVGGGSDDVDRLAASAASARDAPAGVSGRAAAAAVTASGRPLRTASAEFGYGSSSGGTSKGPTGLQLLRNLVSSGAAGAGVAGLINGSSGLVDLAGLSGGAAVQLMEDLENLGFVTGGQSRRGAATGGGCGRLGDTAAKLAATGASDGINTTAAGAPASSLPAVLRRSNKRPENGSLATQILKRQKMQEVAAAEMAAAAAAAGSAAAAALGSGLSGAGSGLASDTGILLGTAGSGLGGRLLGGTSSLAGLPSSAMLAGSASLGGVDGSGLSAAALANAVAAASRNGGGGGGSGVGMFNPAGNGGLLRLPGLPAAVSGGGIFDGGGGGGGLLPSGVAAAAANVAQLRAAMALGGHLPGTTAAALLAAVRQSRSGWGLTVLLGRHIPKKHRSRRVARPTGPLKLRNIMKDLGVHAPTQQKKPSHAPQQYSRESEDDDGNHDRASGGGASSRSNGVVGATGGGGGAPAHYPHPMGHPLGRSRTFPVAATLPPAGPAAAAVQPFPVGGGAAAGAITRASPMALVAAEDAGASAASPSTSEVPNRADPSRIEVVADPPRRTPPPLPGITAAASPSPLPPPGSLAAATAAAASRIVAGLRMGASGGGGGGGESGSSPTRDLTSAAAAAAGTLGADASGTAAATAAAVAAAMRAAAAGAGPLDMAAFASALQGLASGLAAVGKTTGVATVTSTTAATGNGNINGNANGGQRTKAAPAPGAAATAAAGSGKGPAPPPPPPAAAAAPTAKSRRKGGAPARAAD
ncbi:hypothetical protein Agub_g7813 [Astrephomene gubernaculifera]|uniref:Uncharacterized protein n=1 Tax=Astrephomene gubernaculifera TaxID=47775 RepID=A0AAD3DUV1_9CHLO|nr:hypothetical protein Agub_g7813 [Astrephomene gubernaculifera]